MTMTPPTIRRILVPTDYSECADQALPWAVLHARTFGAELYVLHVVEKPVHFSTFGYTEGSHAADLQKDHQRLEAHVKTQLRGSDLATNVLVEVGDPVIKVREVAKREQIDLIIIGTHGKGRLEGLLFSSVTDKIVHHSGCPVLAVPPLVEPD